MRPLSFVICGLVLVAGCAPRQAPEAPAAEPTSETAPAGAAPQTPTSIAEPEAPQEAPADEDDLYADLGTLDKAEAALARAQSVLDGLYVAAGPGVEREATKKESTPARSRAAAPSRTPAADADEQAKDDRSHCDTACRAFASLERAADAVCRLAGGTTERCTRAKKLVQDNAGRIAPCACQR